MDYWIALDCDVIEKRPSSKVQLRKGIFSQNISRHQERPVCCTTTFCKKKKKKKRKTNFASQLLLLR